MNFIKVNTITEGTKILNINYIVELESQPNEPYASISISTPPKNNSYLISKEDFDYLTYMLAGANLKTAEEGEQYNEKR